MRALALCVLVAALAPAVADAHRTTSRVHNMREIAVALYGPDVCGDTMAVPISRGPMLSPSWGAYSHHDNFELPYTGCKIVVRDISWPTEYLCRMLMHEYSHLNGYRAPEGQEYIGPDGEPDYHHSRDPLDLMWPQTLSTFAPCANGAADAGATRPGPTAG